MAQFIFMENSLVCQQISQQSIQHQYNKLCRIGLYGLFLNDQFTELVSSKRFINLV